MSWFEVLPPYVDLMRARLVVKNGHQEGMCYDENIDTTILGEVVYTVGKII